MGASIALLLLAVFSALLGSRLAAGVKAPCACFGSSGGPLSWRHLVRNGVLALLCVVVLLGAAGWWSSIAGGLLTAALAALAAAVVVWRDRHP